MPTKKTPSSAKAAPKKAAVKAVVPKTEKKADDLKGLRSEVFSLKMKHALRELKEVHKLKQARRDVARFLTKLNSK